MIAYANIVALLEDLRARLSSPSEAALCSEGNNG